MKKIIILVLLSFSFIFNNAFARDDKSTTTSSWNWIEVKVTEEYKNSTVSRILDLVENATDKKAKTETFVNKASSIYTPIVIGLAAVVAIFLPLFTEIPYTGNNGSIYRALIFLVISRLRQ